jgi:hypothetical protein
VLGVGLRQRDEQGDAGPATIPVFVHDNDAFAKLSRAEQGMSLRDTGIRPDDLVN